MFNLIIRLFLIGHLIACTYYLLALIDIKYNEVNDSWIDDGISLDRIWWKVYLKSMYWSFTLMATGSNECNTVFEIFFITFVMMFICIIYGYMLNTIGVILADMNKHEES